MYNKTNPESTPPLIPEATGFFAPIMSKTLSVNGLRDTSKDPDPAKKIIVMIFLLTVLIFLIKKLLNHLKTT